MTDFYVDSNAVGLNDGTSWTDAWTSITSAPGGISAGDRVFVAHNHSETQGSAMSLAWPGTLANPNRVICANSGSGTPPTTIATTAAVSTTGASTITLTSGGSAAVYFYGIIFTAGNSTSAADISFIGASHTCICESCQFILGGNNSGSDIFFANNSTGANNILKDCDFKVSNSGSQLVNQNAESRVGIIGGSWLSGGTSPTNPFFVVAGSTTSIEGFDFSNLSSSTDIVSSTAVNVDFLIRNSKLPTSWSGSINASTPGIGSNYELFNSDAGDTNYRLEKKTGLGTVTHETTLVKSGGASDGTTQISWKMVTNADAEWNHQTLESPPIIRWNEQIDTTITVTVDILHDSVTALQDDEIWIEIQYLGTTGFPLSLFADDAAADYLATPANQATSSATWTTTGMSNPNEQQLSVDITPREVGYIQAKVHLAKPSYTVYVDPLLLVT